jgi:hypothetical protein
VHWNVGASPVNDQTVTFTVNHLTARERIGFYEPLNTTNEFAVKWGSIFDVFPTRGQHSTREV